jgi:dihydrofolate reductase
MPQASKIFLTRVHANLEGDVFLPEINEQQWKRKSKFDFPADEKHAYAYSFELWEKS